jgi:hypothetical protein
MPLNEAMDLLWIWKEAFWPFQDIVGAKCERNYTMYVPHTNDFETMVDLLCMYYVRYCLSYV